jgi:hypothetical protein
MASGTWLNVKVLVDDWRHTPGLDEVPEHRQTISWVLHGSEGMQLVHERGHDHQLCEVAKAPEPAMARGSVLIMADQNVRPSRG